MSDTFELLGTVKSVLGNNNYVVEAELEGQTRDVMCHLAGKMRQFKINVIVGDKVKIVVPPPYDKGRITYREKG